MAGADQDLAPVVLLDLDGTLIDSGPGIMSCAADAFRAVGLPVPPDDALRAFVGPPIRQSLRAAGLPEELLDAAVRGFRANFAEASITAAQLYPGVLAALLELRARGYRLGIATSKPTVYADAVCRHFGLFELVEGVFGGPPDGEEKSKGDIIAGALLEFGARRAVMIGDRGLDVVGASENGLGCLGVAWGYAEDGELAGAGAAAVVASSDMLAAAVSGYFETQRRKIVVVGAGSAFRDLLSLLPDDVDVLALGDNNPLLHGTEVLGHQVLPVDALVRLPFDRCVIAARAVDELRHQLRALGVPAERISAYYPSYSRELVDAVRANTLALNRDLGTQLPLPWIANTYLWPDPLRDSVDEDAGDGVRRRAMQLAAELVEQRGVVGAVGELGVYRGETAAFLSRLFRDRELHLFDTLTGFAASDVAAEAASVSSTVREGDFSDTDPAYVLALMTGPNRVVLHQGMFPTCAEGVDAQFAFVSLDVDLYAPTLAGLSWFYPRLSPGGYIFVHDFNNRRFDGVRRAVSEFLQTSRASAVPLPDFAGSLVITR